MNITEKGQLLVNEYHRFRLARMKKTEIMTIISDELAKGGWSKMSTIQLSNGTVFLGKPTNINSSEVRDGEWYAVIEFHNTITEKDQWCHLDDIVSITN